MIRTRIAPSPTGIAHLGTAYIAMRNWALARQSGGKFIIRIEDTDRQRYVEGAVEVIFEAMKWLGLDYDEAPDIGGPYAPYTQSQRLDLYRKYVQQLIDQGKAYYCFCSKERLAKVRKDQQQRGERPRYDRHCRHLSHDEVQQHLQNGDDYVVRLRVPETGTTTFIDPIHGEISWNNSEIDDQILLKSDGYPTYHLAVVVDDHLMGITHVIRGEEWISSAPKHVLLYQAFGWKLPVFAHLPIIRNKDKSKMSKRKNDVSILSHRDKGYLPEAINNFLGLMGWSHPDKKEIFSLEEFKTKFTLERVTTTAPVYDLDKLNWLNGRYIRALSDQDLLQRLKPFIPQDCSLELASKILPQIKERLVTLADFETLTYFFYRDITVDSKLLHKKSPPKQVQTQLQTSIQSIKVLGKSNFIASELEIIFRDLVHQYNWKPRQFFMMLRIALTGEKATPPLFDTMEIIGFDKTIQRLNALID